MFCLRLLKPNKVRVAIGNDHFLVTATKLHQNQQRQDRLSFFGDVIDTVDFIDYTNRHPHF